jgi:hypothetical protein
MSNINWFFYNESKASAGIYTPVAGEKAPQLNEGKNVLTVPFIAPLKTNADILQNTYLPIIAGDFGDTNIILESNIQISDNEKLFMPYSGMKASDFNLKNLSQYTNGLGIFGNTIKQQFFTLDFITAIGFDTRFKIVSKNAINNFYLGLLKVN